MPDTKEILLATFKNSRYGMILVHMDQSLKMVNSAVCALLGYEEDELLQMRFCDFTHPDDMAINEALFEDLKSGKGQTYEIVKRIKRKNGDIRYARLTATPVMDSMGAPKLGAITMEDMTRDEEAAEKLRIAAKIYENSEEGV
ncbi:MAG: PAS domain S-box protein, partial [Nitrospinota bacterium]|nr:PAS domain S-box protein [Nitrospinota bacterium]